jgi:hypothetical protein
LECGSQIEITDADRPDTWGCVESGDDEDYFSVELPACTGTSPHLSLTLQFHVAFAPLQVKLVDSSDAVVAEGDVCGDAVGGLERVCLDLAAPAAGEYRIQVQSTGEANCEGDCAYNRYLLRLSYPLS